LITLTILSCVPSRPDDYSEILSADRLINKLEANRRRVKNFEGNGTLMINTPTLDNSANFKVVLVKPDSIFLNILGPFGIELGQALVTSKEFIFYDALSNTAYTGEIDSEVLQNIFRIDLPFKDIVDALTGSVNLSNQLYKSPNDFKVISDKYHLTYIDSASGLITDYKIDVRRLGITDYHLISKDSNIKVIGSFSNFEILENVAIPLKISVENKFTNQKLEINYKKITVNKKGLHIDFKLPEDADLVRW
jgi:hypothetical protein